MPGLCTLTATVFEVLPLSVPLYTCPMDAEATGRAERVSKVSRTSLIPSCRCRTLYASCEGKGGTASWSCRSSSA